MPVPSDPAGSLPAVFGAATPADDETRHPRATPRRNDPSPDPAASGQAMLAPHPTPAPASSQASRGVSLRSYILVFLLIFGLTPLVLAAMINLPLVLDRTSMFYQRAYLQNLRADFRDLDQHLASRHEMIRLLSKLPEPGLIFGEQGDAEQIDVSRARYTAWINQILADQRDIIQILFVGEDGLERFWLARDARTLDWRPTAAPAQMPNQRFLTSGLELQPGAVMVSRIRVDAAAGLEDPRQLMTLSLVSRVGGEKTDDSSGLVVMTIDVGGLAQFYRDTLWVNHNGSYLRPGQPASGQPEAFETFPGLAEIFAGGTLALWTGRQGRQLLWVPMFLTEDGYPLWVGRAVDPSPIEAFRDALVIRVVSIILVLVVVVMVLARIIAARAERFGRELKQGLGQILRDGQPLSFDWSGPREIRELGEQLTVLARTHADHIQVARAHTRELERSNRFKSEFLANVSHELRTPLNSILLLSKMLAAESSGLNPAQRRQSQVIQEAGQDLRTMIDNILDISRIEAGHVSVSPEWVSLRPVLEELLELVEPQVGEKPVRLQLVVDPRAARSIYTDCDKLRQILKNFLANAVKFTAEGHILLSVEPLEESVDEIALSVSDTGIGIPLDKQEIIFEAFQQADGSTRRRYGGTGLGLSISRELAGLLGGRIQVESAPGAGARFTLILPLTPPPGGGHENAPSLMVRPDGAHPGEVVGVPGVDQQVASPPHPDGWVLIVERDVKTLVQLASECSRLGFRVQTAADRDEALETLQEEPGCTLILLAASSPVETCDTIQVLSKAGEGPRPSIAILVDGSRDGPFDACSGVGAVDRLPKPIDTERLAALLAKVTESVAG